MMNTMNHVAASADGMDLTSKYNKGIVAVSIGISFLGAYMTTSLCEQLRASLLHRRLDSVRQKWKWFALMGIALGGIGIWCMHFIGMASLSISVNDQEVDLEFNVLISIVSLIVVVVLTTIGVAVSSQDPLFMKTKGEILEMFIQDTSKLSMSEVRRMKNLRLLRLISTKSLGYLVTGGVIAGSGVSIMHYIGMEAMYAHSTIRWNPGVVAASVLIAIIASTVAFWILFRLLSLFPSREWLRLVSSFLMAVAVCGMHYTGMAAARFDYESNMTGKKYDSHYMSKDEAFYPVIAAAMIMISIITIILLADLRSIVHRYSAVLSQSGTLPMIQSNSSHNKKSSSNHSSNNHHHHSHENNQNRTPSLSSGIIRPFNEIKILPGLGGSSSESNGATQHSYHAKGVELQYLESPATTVHSCHSGKRIGDMSPIMETNTSTKVDSEVVVSSSSSAPLDV